MRKTKNMLTFIKSYQDKGFSHYLKLSIRYLAFDVGRLINDDCKVICKVTVSEKNSKK